jgi:hypothetical protein
MKKPTFLIAISISISIFLTACAGITKLYGEYNPEKYPSSQLATIFEKKRSFGQRFIEQTYYRILTTNGLFPNTVHDGFSKFAPGVHYIDWVYIEIVDGGMWTTHEVRSSGSLLVTLEEAANYRLGIQDHESEVSVWNEVSGKTVSQPCSTNCEELKLKLSVDDHEP